MSAATLMFDAWVGLSAPPQFRLRWPASVYKAGHEMVRMGWRIVLATNVRRVGQFGELRGGTRAARRALGLAVSAHGVEGADTAPPLRQSS